MKEHSITGGYKIGQAFEALGEFCGARPDDHCRHIVKRMTACAEIFHIAVIAYDYHQPFIVIPCLKHAAKNLIKLFKQ